MSIDHKQMTSPLIIGIRNTKKQYHKLPLKRRWAINAFMMDNSKPSSPPMIRSINVKYRFMINDGFTNICIWRPLTYECTNTPFQKSWPKLQIWKSALIYVNIALIYSFNIEAKIYIPTPSSSVNLKIWKKEAKTVKARDYWHIPRCLASNEIVWKRMSRDCWVCKEWSNRKVWLPTFWLV